MPLTFGSLVFFAFGVLFLLPAVLIFRLAVRDWSKLMGAPPIVRLWGLGFLGGVFLVSAGLFFAAAALPHESNALLVGVAALWIARWFGMRLTARRIADLHLDH